MMTPGVASVTFLIALLAPPEGPNASKAKSYLREVRKHLLESYIDGKKLDRRELGRVAVRGLVKGLDHPDFAEALDDQARAKLRKSAGKAETFEGAITIISNGAPDLDILKLSDHGVRAMIAQTGDPFSRLMTSEDLTKIMKTLREGTRRDALGCSVEFAKDGTARIAYVQYGTAAYREGLRIGDTILEVRGRKMSEVDRTDIVELFRLPPGQTLKLKIRRDGRDYPFTIHQVVHPVPNVQREYLGHGVGYIRLTMFDNSSGRDIRSALYRLRREGMRGLILDLRNNPGGALPAAVTIADQFLAPGMVVANIDSHYRPTIFGIPLPFLGLEPVMKAKQRNATDDMPLVVLVNGASASASELLVAALRDHDRAVLVGEKTYGKGRGQGIIHITSMGMTRFLYLTILRFTSPGGETVDHVGVPVHRPFPDPAASDRQFPDVWKLRRSGAVKRYVETRWGDGLRALGKYDGFESSRYPGFDDFYGGLKTDLSRDRVRAEVRRSIRRRMEDEGTTWGPDLEADRVLQKGLVEILDLLEKKN